MQEIIDTWLKYNTFVGVIFCLLFVIIAVFSKQKKLLAKTRNFHHFLWLLISTHYLGWYGLFIFPVATCLSELCLTYIPVLTLLPALCFACMYPLFLWFGSLGLFAGLILAVCIGNAIEYLGVDIFGRGYTPFR